MLHEGINIELTYRLRAMNRIVDRIVPNSHDQAFDEVVEVMLEAATQRKFSDAAAILEDALQANTSWLRGYLLLATIYQSTEQFIRAITTLRQGLNICIKGSRLFSLAKWAAMMDCLNGPHVHERVRRSAERFKRYEQIFRHRMAMVQTHTGDFDDALENWVALVGERSV